MPEKRKPVECCLTSLCSTYEVWFRCYLAQGKVGITCRDPKKEEAFFLVKPVSFFRLAVESTLAHVLREGGEVMDAWILIPFTRVNEPTVEVTLSLEKLVDFIDRIDGHTKKRALH